MSSGAILQAEYEQWRLALGDEGRASLATMKRIRALERELARKEEGARRSRRIAGAQKNLQPLEEDEDVDTDKEHEP